MSSLLTFGFFTPTTGVILLILALILFGPGKLPDLGRSVGQGITEFRRATEKQAAAEKEK